ncbi:MAG TPA: ATP-binding protein [Candidatus Hydrogenedens sp.]|nr:ATP-binding protein [Candidatus Hydrogenedens sp.]
MRKQHIRISRSREKILSLLLPFIIGFGGLFISQEVINSESLKFTIALLSIALPSLFTIIILNKYRSSTREKVLLIFGIILLFISGIWIITRISINPFFYATFPEEVRRLAEFIGLGSLLLGILSFVIILIHREENIDELAERFKALAEHISEGYVLSNTEGIIVDVNEQFCRFISLSRKEIIGSTVQEMTRRYQADNVEQNWLSRSYGLSGEYEVELQINNQKKYFWFHGTPIFDSKGRHKATLATVKDITELKVLSEKVSQYAEELEKRVEEQTHKLRESEENLKQLIMTMNEGFLLLDMQHKIIMANDCFCSMVDKIKEQVLGHYIFEFLESNDLLPLLSLLETERKERRREITFLRSDKKEIPALVSVSIIPNEKIEETKFSLVIADLSQQKKMQNDLEERTIQLEKLNEELKQYGKNKDTFLSNVSHELRTPISTIQGYIEMMLSQDFGPINPNQANALEIMIRNAQRLLRMVNEMIEFSRMEIKGLQLKKKLFSIKELIEENVAFNNPKIIEKQIKIIDTYKDKEIYVWADRDKISQVIGILLNNAVKFTDTGGSIEVSTNVNESNVLEISVSDTGIGIPLEYQDKIFEKFFQIDSSPTRKYEGTGIGLAVAKGIIETHKGNITVHSEPNKGSRFTIILPDCIFYVAETEHIENNLLAEKILIVDNESALFNSLIEINKDWQAKIERIKNEYESIRVINETTPDIVLINTYGQDIENIISLINVFEERLTSENIPIIFIIDESINLSNSYLKSFPENIYFIKKPFNIKQLLEFLNKLYLGEELSKVVNIDGKKEPDRGKIIAVYEPESSLRELINFMMNYYGISCIFPESFESTITWIIKYSLSTIIIDLDEVKDEDLIKLSEIDNEINVQKIYLVSDSQIKKRFENNFNGNCVVLSKPFLFDDLLRLLKLSPEKSFIRN